MQPENIALWLVGGTAGTGIFFWMVRYLLMLAFNTKSDIQRVNATDQFSERLAGEIHRLEEIIERQNRRIDELEQTIINLRKTALDDLSDIAELNAIVETACMFHGIDKCSSGNKLREILSRMRSRRQS